MAPCMMENADSTKNGAQTPPPHTHTSGYEVKTERLNPQAPRKAGGLVTALMSAFLPAFGCSDRYGVDEDEELEDGD